jgi:hypothetical protein
MFPDIAASASAHVHGDEPKSGCDEALAVEAF